MASVNGTGQANGGNPANPRNNQALQNAQTVAEFEKALAEQIFLTEAFDQFAEEQEEEAKLEEQKAEDEANNV